MTQMAWFERKFDFRSPPDCFRMCARVCAARLPGLKRRFVAVLKRS